MNRERVLELANDAGITFINPTGVASATSEWLERFAALIEAEVRGDAEPVAYMMVNDAHKHPPSLHWKPQQWHITWEVIPLYLHPAPAVVAQLVEALEIIAGDKQCLDNAMGNADVARAALAAVRGSK